MVTVSVYFSVFGGFSQFPLLQIFSKEHTIPFVSSLTIIYASTSGHTEHVVQVLSEYLEKGGVDSHLLKAEAAKPEDLKKGDLIYFCGDFSYALRTPDYKNYGGLNPKSTFIFQECKKKLRLEEVLIFYEGQHFLLYAISKERYSYFKKISE